MTLTPPNIILTIASAGTGKTYSLVENYVKALLGLDGYQKRRPKEILALTFTEKAALEMRERISSRLNELRHSADLPHSKDEQKRLENALQEANISTFHSFAMNILREFAVDLGIFNQFEIITGIDERRYAENILRSIIVEEVKNQDNHTLKSLIARFRLTNKDGSGLINHLIFLAENIKEKSLRPLEILPSENSDFSARLFLDDIDDALRIFKQGPLTEIAKQRLTQIEHAYEEFRQVFGGMNEAKIAFYLEELLASLKGNFGPAIARKNLVEKVHIMCAKLVDWYVHNDEQEILRLLQLFSTEYEQKKKAHGFLTYGDLLMFTKDALLYHPNIRQKLKQRFTHILVDEYQDTSPLQEDILALLIQSVNDEPFLNKRSLIEQISLDERSSLFIVGDKKQSIYSFRGAFSNIFERIEALGIRPHSVEIVLDKRHLNINRRSSEKILNVANLLSRQALLHQGYSAHDDLKPFHEHDESEVSLWTFDDETLGAHAACALGVKKLLDEKAFAPSDIAVLTRKRSSITAIKDALHKLSIPARIMHGEGFYQRQEIVDLIAALKLSIAWHHEQALSIVMRSSLLFMRDEDLLALKLSHGLSFEGLLRYIKDEEHNVPIDVQKRVLVLHEAFLEIGENLLQRDMAWALKLLIDKTDYAYNLGLYENGKAKLLNVEKLMAIGLKDENPHVAINRLFGYLNTNFEEPTQEDAGETDAVSIMTIHQSKGLEFLAVVLADCESSGQRYEGDLLYDDDLGLSVAPKGRSIKAVVPHSDEVKTRFQRAQEKKRAEKEQEEARLLYVALTRAKTHCYALLKEKSFLQRKSSGLMGLLLNAMRNQEEEFFSHVVVEKIEEGLSTFFKASEQHFTSGVIPSFPRDLINDSLCFDEEVPWKARDDVKKSSTTKEGIAQAKVFEGKAFETIIPKPVMYRIFASSLTLENPTPIRPFTNLLTPSRIEGDLAHTLFNALVESIDSLADDELKTAIDAAFRQASGQENLVNERTKEAVHKTLVLLKSELRDADNIMSELFVQGFFREKYLLEGFCDLVFLKQGQLFLVDYKSSSFLANHHNTYAQLLAYSYCLSKTYACPVHFTSVVIGSLEPLSFRPFDDEAEALLERSINAHDATNFDASSPKDKHIDKGVEVGEQPGKIGWTMQDVDENVGG